MNRTITWVAAALLALGACNKKSENPPAPTPGSSAMAAGSGSAMAAGSGSAMAAGSGSAMAAGSGTTPGRAAGSGSAAPAAAVDVPTEMDFESDATAKITDKNVEVEVKSLEKQLEQK